MSQYAGAVYIRSRTPTRSQGFTHTHCLTNKQTHAKMSTHVQVRGAACGLCGCHDRSATQTLVQLVRSSRHQVRWGAGRFPGRTHLAIALAIWFGRMMTRARLLSDLGINLTCTPLWGVGPTSGGQDDGRSRDWSFLFQLLCTGYVRFLERRLFA